MLDLSKESLSLMAFEIVSYSGDARSKLLQAVKEAKKQNFENAKKLIENAKECLNEAHNSQTELMAAEAQGKEMQIGFLTVHAQDHLMTTLLLKDIIENLLDIYR